MSDLITSLKGKFSAEQIKEALVTRHLQSKKYVNFLNFLTYTLDKQVLLQNPELLQDVFSFFDPTATGVITGASLKE
jgi:Ca2+-binding EF-hand superfamily protein